MTRFVLFIALVFAITPVATADPLPSWNDGASKTRIMDFVASVTDPAKETYVTPAGRIAVFDNDGTLWAEKPVYFQLIYAMDWVRERGAADPAFLKTDALKAAAAGDIKKLMAGGEKALLEVVAVSHSNISVADFEDSVRTWLATARHPRFDKPYDALVYQPMLELLRYLRDVGFSTYIVSGGGVHFMRAFTDTAYNIPAENVIGSRVATKYEIVEGVAEIMKLPEIDFINDKAGKPVGIDSKIGKRPILAVGNSDGDFQMLQWTTSGEGPRLGMLVHHTDAEREWAYDRDSHVGQLVKGLDEGPKLGWQIIDMKTEWAKVFPFD